MDSAMTLPQVSVILPVYNGAATIEAAIESIRTQSLQSWELIVVDDCSSDSTPQRLAKFAQIDSRIRILRNGTNLGIGGSLNVAWRHCVFELIARMDADDISLPKRLERQAELMASHPDISILGTAIERVDRDGRNLGPEFRPELHDDLVARLYKEIPVFHPTVMMRRTFLTAVGGYDANVPGKAEDLELWLRSYHRFRFHNLREIHLKYRLPAGNKWSELRERTRVMIHAAKRDRSPPIRWWYVARAFFAGLRSLVGLRAPR